MITLWCCSYSSFLVELVDLTWYLRKDMGKMTSVGLERCGFEGGEKGLSVVNESEGSCLRESGCTERKGFDGFGMNCVERSVVI